MRRAGRVVSRDTIVNAVWGFEQDSRRTHWMRSSGCSEAKSTKAFDRNSFRPVRASVTPLPKNRSHEIIPHSDSADSLVFRNSCCGLSLFGLSAYLEMRNSIHETVDEALRERVKGVHGLILRDSQYGEDDVKSELRQHSELAGGTWQLEQKILRVQSPASDSSPSSFAKEHRTGGTTLDTDLRQPNGHRTVI